MFCESVPPAPGTKGTVKMSWHPADGREIPSARPRSRIVGKDEPTECFESATELSDGSIVLGYRGKFITSPFGLQVRSGDSFSCQLDVPGLAPPHCFSRDHKQMLTSGPFEGGYEATVRLANTDDWQITCEIPMRYPFAWLPDGRIVASTPHHMIHLDKGSYWYDGVHADPESLESNPWLTELAQEGDTLIVVDVLQRQACKLTNEPMSLDEWVAHFELAVGDEHVFFATESTLGAVAIKSGKVVWQHLVPRPQSWDYYHPQAMAVSPDGRTLAVGARCGGAPGQLNLLLFDALTGEVVHGWLFPDSITALAWHPTGWLAAASSKGHVWHLAMDGSRRFWKAATRGIQSICFIDGATQLLVCGTEKQLRLWPLFADEIGEDGVRS